MAACSGGTTSQACSMVLSEALCGPPYSLYPSLYANNLLHVTSVSGCRDLLWHVNQHRAL